MSSNSRDKSLLVNEFSTLEVSDFLASSLIGLGIRDVFLVTGGPIAPLTNSLVKSGQVHMHYMTTEDSAAIAAEAYGQYDGKPALLLLTSGPGVSNALTGVAAGWTNSSPIFIVSGQAKVEDIQKSKRLNSRQVGNQHLDAKKIVSGIVKKFEEPLESIHIHKILRELYKTSIADRMGPVWLSLAADLQRAQVKSVKIRLDPMRNNESRFKFGDYFIVAKILRELMKAKKPVLFLGNGIRGSNIHSKIEEFLSIVRIPALTTWTGIDLLSESNEFYFGRPGTLPSSWSANLVQQKADLLLIFGARLDGAQVGFQKECFAPNAKVIRIEIDKNEFFRLSKGSNWHGDARRIFSLLLNKIKAKSREIPDYTEWLKEAQSYQLLPKSGEYNQELVGVSTYSTAKALAKESWPDVVLGSSGTCVEMTLQSWEIETGQRFLNSGGLGSMGFALPAAIGVYQKVKREVLCIESDGSLLMNIQEFYNLKHKNAQIKVVILNSQGFKSIYLSQSRLGHVKHGCDSESGVANVDIEKLANSINIPYKRVYETAELQAAIKWLKEIKSPAILDVIVSRDETVNPRLLSKVNHQGQMQTANFTDLSPRLKDYSNIHLNDLSISDTITL